jgi:hypothetical protein
MDPDAGGYYFLYGSTGSGSYMDTFAAIEKICCKIGTGKSLNIVLFESLINSKDPVEQHRNNP